MSSTENILKDIPKHNYKEPAANINKEEFIKLVKSRRSVRVFTDDAVNPKDIKECLELALLAPTSSNLQCWEFYWAYSFWMDYGPRKSAALLYSFGNSNFNFSGHGGIHPETQCIVYVAEAA